MTTNKKLFRMITAALFAALITLMTAFLFHIPTGLNQGYIHLGDAFVYLAASMLPLPYALCAAGIGGGLADILSGAVIWAPATLIIKMLLAALFSAHGERMLGKRNLVVLLPAAAVTMGGYYVAAALIFGNWAAPVAELLPNLIQAVGSAVVYVLLAAALDKIGFKQRVAL